MKKSLRRLLRLAALLGVTLAFLLVILLWPIWLSRSIRMPGASTGGGDERGRMERLGRCHRRLAKIILAILGVSVDYHGPRPEAVPGRLMVSNHLGYLDILLIGSIYPVVFVAKSEVAAWPIIGWLARLLGTIFLRRGVARSSVVALYRGCRLLRRGLSFHVFPEGTTTNGRTLAGFHPHFFAAAVRTRRPVLPLTLRVEEVTEDGRRLPDPEEILCWHGEAALVPHLWRLLRIDSARLTLVGHDEILHTPVDSASSLAREAEWTISDGLERPSAANPEQSAGEDWAVELVAGAMLFAMLCNFNHLPQAGAPGISGDSFPINNEDGRE